MAIFFVSRLLLSTCRRLSFATFWSFIIESRYVWHVARDLVRVFTSFVYFKNQCIARPFMYFNRNTMQINLIERVFFFQRCCAVRPVIIYFFHSLNFCVIFFVVVLQLTSESFNECTQLEQKKRHRSWTVCRGASHVRRREERNIIIIMNN